MAFSPARWCSHCARRSGTGQHASCSSNHQTVAPTAQSSAPPPNTFCYSHGSAGACPCGNNGAGGRGCEKSAHTGGAVLSASDNASLLDDTFALSASGPPANVMCLVFRGDATLAAVVFGDAQLCVGGARKRLFIKHATTGSSSAPLPGNLTITQRSEWLGDTIAPDSTCCYQAIEGSGGSQVVGREREGP